MMVTLARYNNATQKFQMAFPETPPLNQNTIHTGK
jgi:hypothetical protein